MKNEYVLPREESKYVYGKKWQGREIKEREGGIGWEEEEWREREERRGEEDK